MFLEVVPDEIETLNKMLQEEAAAKCVRGQAYKVKDAFAHISATRLKQIAFEIEDAAAENNLILGRNTFQLLESEFEKLCQAISYEAECT